MQALSFEEGVEMIMRKDPRYPREAYLFLRDALEHTQKMVTPSPKNEEHHVTGQELLEGIRDFALKQYGPMTLMLLHEWGVYRCEDFGELVFNLVDNHLLRKT